MGPQGLPLVKPPYGRITAYNMNTGDIVWQVANGDTYEWIKTHPALKGLTIPKTGRADEGGIVVTKTLAFAGQGCGLVPRRRRRRPDVLCVRQGDGRGRARNGLPASTCGNPMTYMVNGKQYIVVAVGAAELPRRAGGAVAAVAGGRTFTIADRYSAEAKAEKFFSGRAKSF